MSRDTPSACSGCFDASTKVIGLKQACRDYQTVVNRQTQRIAVLEEQNRRVEQENNDLATRVGDLKDMLASKAAPTGNPGASLIGDADVLGLWTELCFGVRQLVTDHVNPSGKRGISMSALRTLTRADEVILRDEDRCGLLAQAVIWSILAEHVFGSGAKMSRMFWAGEFSEDLRCLCRCLARPGGGRISLTRC